MSRTRSEELIAEARAIDPVAGVDLARVERRLSRSRETRRSRWRSALTSLAIACAAGGALAASLAAIDRPRSAEIEPAVPEIAHPHPGKRVLLVRPAPSIAPSIPPPIAAPIAHEPRGLIIAHGPAETGTMAEDLAGSPSSESIPPDLAGSLELPRFAPLPRRSPAPSPSPPLPRGVLESGDSEP